MKSKAIQKVLTTKNFDTGEIEETILDVRKMPIEKEYIKIYVEAITLITQIPKSSTNVLLECLKHLTYADNKQTINTNKLVKEEIARNCNISVSRVNDLLTIFCKAGIFKRIIPSIFMVNPNYIAKGSYADICKLKKIWIDVEHKTIIGKK